MSKFSYKSLFIIFFFLLIGIIVLWKFILPNQKVSAEWWNDNWHYRQAINISSHNTNESNVYIIASINIGSTTKAQTDDGDFRFITQSGDVLPYYISSGTGTTAITFHIQFTSFPSGAQTIYAYYGNSTIENGFSASDFSTQASNYTIGSYSTEEAGGGPVAYWKFDEGVGTTAYDSAGFYNGTLTGSTLPTWIEAKSNTGIAFSGVSDYVSIPYKPNFREAVTVSIWMKRTTGYNQLADVMFLSPPNAWYFYDSYNSGSVHGDVYIDGVRKGAINVPVPFDGNWYHITYTYDSATHFAKMYKNGVLYQSVEITGLSNYLIDPATGNLYSLGRNSLGRGMILDEPKIYNYARTADQIKQDYNSRGSLSGSSANLGIQSSTAPSISSKLVGYWKFDEGNGNFTNNSGNGGIGLSAVFASGSSAPTWTNNGKVNKALNLGGNNYLTATDNSNTLDFGTNGFSISFDTYRTATGYQGGGYIRKGSYTNGIDCYDNNFRVNTVNGELAHVGLNATLNKWEHHLFVVTQNSTPYIKHYINGKLDNTGYVGIGNTGIFGSDSASDLIIGYSNAGGANRFFNGTIDEIKIYNTSLNDQEVFQDYNQGSAISFGSTTQTIGGTTTDLNYCIPGDTSYCASPIVEYNFEENTGTTAKDTSGNNNDISLGTGTSTPSWTTGKTGSSLNFDGVDDIVNIGNPSFLDFGNNSFSFNFWVNPSSSVGAYDMPFYKGGSSAGNTGIDFEFGTGGWGSGLSDGTTGKYIGLGSETNNKWTYISIVIDRSENKAFGYRDGILTNSVDITGLGSLTTPTSAVLSNSSYKFKGKIDGVKIYDYARTPAQIAYDYNRGGPIGWWKFDECQGSIANDSSGLGNTGVISIGQSGTQNSLGTCQIGTSAAWTNGASGKYNSSLNFDGTDDRVYGSFTAIGITKPFSMSIWFKTSTTFGYQPGIASLGYSPVIVMKTDGKINVWWYDGSVWPGIDSLQELNNNIWHNVILSYNGITASLYIDGIFQSSLNSTINAVYSGFDIGNEHNGGYKYFNGQIDDYRIYNYGLTPDQIKILYNNGSINFQ